MSTTMMDQRTEGLHQRDAGGLDGGEFRGLTQIAEGDERGEENGERQGLRHHHQRHVPEKLSQDVEGEVLCR